MSLDCLCAGLLVADHLCTPISHLPAPGELVVCDELVLAVGGCAANTAIDLAKLGAKVGLVGSVGDDVFGRFVIDALSAAGVDAKRVRTLAGVGTSGTLIVNVKGQDRRYVHTRGANAAFTHDMIPLDLLDGLKTLYLGGYLLMPALDPVGLSDVFRQARKQGVRTVLDVVLPGPGDHLARLAAVLPETDVFLPNSDESLVITGLSDPLDQAKMFREMGAKTVVVTCGGKGAILMTDGLTLRCGVYPVDFVDGTGSGDAFDAGYLQGLMLGGDPTACLQWGSALGASAVRGVGATAAVFTRAEAAAWIANHSLPVDVIS